VNLIRSTIIDTNELMADKESRYRFRPSGPRPEAQKMSTLNGPLDTLTAALQRYGCALKPVGVGKWKAQCPAHPDDNPSLDISIGDKHPVIFKCWAGCTNNDVLAALGLSWGDVMDEKKKVSTGSIVALYDYTDETGALLHQKVRYEGKKFRQRQPDGKDGWIWSITEPLVRKVLYRLPEVIDGVKNDDTIYIVEGEKDADTLTARGYVATTGTEGAGTDWPDSYTETLDGARMVVVIADNDKPGKEKARKIAKALRARSIPTELRLPTWGKDVTDHFVADYGIDDLEPLSEAEEPVLFDGTSHNVGASVEAILHPETVDTIGAAPDGLDLGDTSNAERLVMLYGGDIRLVREWNQWLVWDAKRWVPDPNNILITKFAKRVKPYLQALLPQVTGGQKEEMAFARGATRSGSRSAIDDMVKLARSNPKVLVEHADLDADPYLLNAGNGIVDLRTGELLAHDPAKLCTLQCAVDYDPDAISVEFEGFLDQIFGHDAELISYVQRLLGYCCTGIIADHILPVLHGVGANGKSTLIGIVQDTLGDYAVTAPEGLLVAQSHIPHEERIAVLRGRRLVVSNELEEKTTLAEQLVQKLTGGDTLTAREVYGKRFHFKPTQKVVLITNHVPRVTGTKHSIWRRIRLVPFNVVIEEQAQKKDLRDRLVADNGPAILAWLVRGAMSWHELGIGESTAVKDATDEYREAEDLFGAFMAECTMQIELRNRTKVGDLYDRWKTWCGDRGEKPGRMQDFSAALKDSGIKVVPEHGQNYAHGLGIRAAVGVIMEAG
jgi:putative DNA primase/helicase